MKISRYLLPAVVGTAIVGAVTGTERVPARPGIFPVDETLRTTLPTPMPDSLRIPTETTDPETDPSRNRGWDTLYMRDFGTRPDSEEDATSALRQAITAVRRSGRPTVLRFEAGRYDFHAPAGADNRANVAATLREVNDLVIDGSGAEFVGHGRLTLFAAENCRNLTLRNFSLDWQRPYITQASIVAIGDNHVDLAIDRSRYPYRIEAGRIRFSGDDWVREVDPESYSTAFDPRSGAVLYGTRDYPLSDRNALFRGQAREIAPDTVRFFGKVDRQLPVGTLIALYHGRYLATAITLTECRNTRCEQIEFRHSPGMGIYGLRCENILLRGISTEPNRAEKRCFSCVADALHFTSCRGTIELDGCRFDGQGDDALNIHGTYIRLVGISKNRRRILLEGDRFPARHAIRPGDEIWPVDRKSVSRGKCIRISRIVGHDGKRLVAELARPLDDRFQCNDFVENASQVADVRIHDCRFGRGNRARGILITSPGHVEIFNNRFESAGTAILIEGDINYWFESGAVRDLEIRNNLFDNCGTSASNNGGTGWGEAVISITPSFRPDSTTSPAYHRNIRIRNNRIRTYDRPLIHARAVGNLLFADNLIEQTAAFPASASQRQSFRLDGCRNVRIARNRFVGYGNPDIATSHMKPEDLVYEKE